MWKRSFVATTVALGGTVDDALAAAPEADGAVSELAGRLRAPLRATRAAALAEAVRDIVVRASEATLR